MLEYPEYPVVQADVTDTSPQRLLYHSQLHKSQYLVLRQTPKTREMRDSADNLMTTSTVPVEKHNTVYQLLPGTMLASTTCRMPCGLYVPPVVVRDRLLHLSNSSHRSRCHADFELCIMFIHDYIIYKNCVFCSCFGGAFGYCVLLRLLWHSLFGT